MLYAYKQQLARLMILSPNLAHFCLRLKICTDHCSYIMYQRCHSFSAFHRLARILAARGGNGNGNSNSGTGSNTTENTDGREAAAFRRSTLSAYLQGQYKLGISAKFLIILRISQTICFCLLVIVSKTTYSLDRSIGQD